MTWLQVGTWVAYVGVIMPIFLNISRRRTVAPSETAAPAETVAS
jgi:hypothetical protein